MWIRSRSVLVHAVLAGIVLGTMGAPLRASADWPACGRIISGAPDGQVHSSIATDGADL